MKVQLESAHVRTRDMATRYSLRPRAAGRGVVARQKRKRSEEEENLWNSESSSSDAQEDDSEEEDIEEVPSSASEERHDANADRRVQDSIQREIERQQRERWARRNEQGMKVIERGYVELLTYYVGNSTDTAVYRVRCRRVAHEEINSDEATHTWDCTCHDYMLRQPQMCKHIYHVMHRHCDVESLPDALREPEANFFSGLKKLHERAASPSEVATGLARGRLLTKSTREKQRRRAMAH